MRTLFQHSQSVRGWQVHVGRLPGCLCAHSVFWQELIESYSGELLLSKSNYSDREHIQAKNWGLNFLLCLHLPFIRTATPPGSALAIISESSTDDTYCNTGG